MTVVSAVQFSSIDELPAADYSKLKFGSRHSARKLGRQLADAIFEQHYDLLLSTDCVIIPSPYNYVANAATLLTRAVVEELNRKIVAVNGNSVSYSVVHRHVSYTANYGALPKDARMRLLSGDQFFFNAEYLAGKTVIFIDDVKITGTHEERIKIELSRTNLKLGHVIYAYYAEYFGTRPEIEAELNTQLINSPAALVHMWTTEPCDVVVRTIKLLLSQPAEQVASIVQQLPPAAVEAIYAGALGEQYHKIPGYQAALMAIGWHVDDSTVTFEEQ